MINIFLEIIQSKFISFQELYNQYVNKVNFNHLICPYPGCKSKGRYNIHQYYDRKLTLYLNETILDGTVRVSVLMCKSCGHSHALLPDFIIPYNRHSTNLVLECLRDKLNHMSITEICDKYKISIQTIYNWLKRFEFHKIRCDILFVEGGLSFLQTINKIFSFVSISIFLKLYFYEHKLFFLQIIRSP